MHRDKKKKSSIEITLERDVFTASVERMDYNSFTVHIIVWAALFEDRENVSTDTLDLWLDWWLAVSPLSLLSLFSLWFPASGCHYNPSSAMNVLYALLHTHKHIHCINMQILAGPHSTSQQAVCCDWVSYCTGCLSLSLSPLTVGW